VKSQTDESAGPFTIQIRSFTGCSNSDRMKESLNLRYGNVSIDDVTIEGEQYYRVRIGNFSTLSKTIGAIGKL
jgi:cell division protein FtsN